MGGCLCAYLTHTSWHCFDLLKEQPPARAGYLEKLQLPKFSLCIHTNTYTCHFPSVYTQIYAETQPPGASQRSGCV